MYYLMPSLLMSTFQSPSTFTKSNDFSWLSLFSMPVTLYFTVALSSFTSDDTISTSTSLFFSFFSELSPRPHDTGMVTLAGTQNFNEFELHLRTILSLPIAEITLERNGASAVILASENSINPNFSGVENIAALPKTDFRLFGKPTSRPYRRMGVALTYDSTETPVETVVERAKEAAALVKVNC